MLPDLVAVIDGPNPADKDVDKDALEEGEAEGVPVAASLVAAGGVPGSTRGEDDVQDEQDQALGLGNLNHGGTATL